VLKIHARHIGYPAVNHCARPSRIVLTHRCVVRAERLPQDLNQSNSEEIRVMVTVTSKVTADTILPMDVIRTRTGTDDVMRVPDMVLEMYRDASLEMAEKYSGLVLRGSRPVIEPLNYDRQMMAARGVGRVALKYVPIDGMVRIVGDSINEVVLLPDGSNIFDFRSLIIGGSWCRSNSCASACGGDMAFHYDAGVKCASEVPSSIKIGCLQYIAWAIENPGDVADAWSVVPSTAIANWTQHRSPMF
jgi:hypothetical protein